MMTKVVGFDADDTLWHSGSYFVELENTLIEKLAPWAEANKVSKSLLNWEIEHLGVYGYGAKGYTLALVDTAIHISNKEISAEDIAELIYLGRQLHNHPVELLNGVVDCLHELRNDYPLYLITKGDIWHQEAKIVASGLADLFTDFTVVAEKSVSSYKRYLSHIGVKAENFLMVGNSRRSDILPVLEMGGAAIHIPYGDTWAYEDIALPKTDRFTQVRSLAQVPGLVRSIL